MAVLVRFAIDKGAAIPASQGRFPAEVNVKCIFKPGPLPDHLVEVVPGKAPGTLELQLAPYRRPDQGKRPRAEASA